MTKVDSFAYSELGETTDPGTKCARDKGLTPLRAEVDAPGLVRRHDLGPS